MSNYISDKPVLKLLVDLCHQNGMEHVVISPGSRNAPLIISFAGCGLFNCLTVVDERCAGYFALGLSRAVQKPVGLVCTSGTAALNLTPAVAEAFYQQIPLIVLTADRPSEWIDQGDGQAIRQNGIFENFSQFQCQLPAEHNHIDDEWYTKRLINEAFIKATGKTPGPAHINIPFRDPLYGKIEYPGPKPTKIETIKTSEVLPESTINSLVNEIGGKEKIMVLLGALNPDDRLNKAISILAGKGAVILSETLSNCSCNSIKNVDRVVSTITKDEQNYYTPDLLITLDVPVLSKMVKEFLRTIKPTSHWHFSNNEYLTDSYQCLTKNIYGDPAKIIFSIAQQIESLNKSYSELWNKRAEQTEIKHDKFISEVNWCDLKLFNILSKKIPANFEIHLGNSTPVRYVQLFNWNNENTWFANRGTSGIDGCVSSAVGASYGSKRPVLLIVGDISFFYDSNGLWNNYINPDFRIILINNSGGGIFRFIQGPTETNELEKFFETKHSLNAQGIAVTYGLNYLSCNNEASLNESLKTLFEPRDKPAILEIFTPNVENGLLLREYFSFLKG